MSEHKHTPGPWRVFTPEDYEGPSSLPGLGVENHEGKAVVWYAAEPETGLENDHDARLIAAAPSLLEALENLLAVHEGKGGTRYHAGDIARAAIAKATGQA
ncbi:hypothetical protein [Azotobacter salinestris]|uniref:hypothetical protein n=1 Tax=Azotobacter salinestris TaxID=69964 RepID=UPI001266A403|nr:hypothetical protein [Azotobacter salinestris]